MRLRRPRWVARMRGYKVVRQARWVPAARQVILWPEGFASSAAPAFIPPPPAITLRGTVALGGTALTRTLNCAAGGNWTTAPQPGDLMVVQVVYGDDSGIPNAAAPSGWTGLDAAFRSIDSPTNTAVRQVFYRFFTAGDGTFTWTAMSNGQTGQLWSLLGFCLTGAKNPITFDTFFGYSTANADTVTQNAPSLTLAQAGSAILAGWAQAWGSAPQYASLAAINGKTPTMLTNAGSSVVSFAAAFGLWLAAGAGTWTPSATRGSGGTFPGLWASWRFGVRKA